MNNGLIIAIDGFSSTGKSTVAKKLAKALGYIYVDTGAMYRAVTYYALQKQLVHDGGIDTVALTQQLPNVGISFVMNPQLGFAEVYLNGVNIEAQIRTLEVSRYVSKIAAISAVRRKLVEQQQHMGKGEGLVMDGRDIGTVVFPHADLKIYMTASAEVRAKRRYEELLERGHTLTYEQVLENVMTRDHIDSTREDSPLVKAEDAIAFDNSKMTIEEQLTAIMALVDEITDTKKTNTN